MLTSVPATDIPTIDEIDAEIEELFASMLPVAVAAYCVACGRPCDSGLCQACLETPGAW